MIIIFDFDGTLFDTESVDVEAINRALEAVGRKPLSKPEILVQIGHPMHRLSKNLLKTTDKKIINKFVKTVIQQELLLIPRSAKLFPFAHRLLENLQQRGHRMAVCSNGSKAYIKAVVKHMNLGKYFDVIWYKHKNKTKLASARRVVKKMDARKCLVYVGDRQEDMDIANSIGAIAIGVMHGFGSKDELKDADYKVQNLVQLNEILTELECKHE